MKPFLLRSPLAAAAALALCGAALPAAAQQAVTADTPSTVIYRSTMPTEKTQNGIAYLAGGVGIEARRYMEDAAREYNLRLSFAAEQDRHYVPDVGVTVYAPDGERLLVVADAGPLFYARMPAGTYRVEVNYRGETQTRTLRVDGGLAQANFLWKPPYPRG
ncbi:MAG: carboxypeptidase regulatory-like domain-containing protein [Burkholderiales bacterium]|nr:carboxypeptidase regulatory-like domain-containing protein [Burkholderiales bacterium]